jgi:FixJ family two-component response regulator
MPKMEGFELYEEIKKKDYKAKVCFLAASELYYEEFRKKEYYALDKSLFIRKPIDNKELLKEVNRIISSAREKLCYILSITDKDFTILLSVL